MEFLIETFSSLWRTKFPGSDLPDTSFFTSKENVEREIKNRTDKINKLKLEIAKEEFLLIYLNQAHENKGLWEVIDRTMVNTNPSNVNEEDDIEGKENRASSTTSDVFTDDNSVYDVPKRIPSDNNKGVLKRNKKSTSLDSASSHVLLSSSSKSLSMDSSDQKYFTFKSVSSNSNSSDDDNHDYMNADEYLTKPLPNIPKPLPKSPIIQEEIEYDKKDNDDDDSDSDLYENFHMKPTLQKLKKCSESEDEDVVEVIVPKPEQDDQIIYSVPSGIPDKKRSGSRDQKRNSFSNDLNVTYNTTLLSPTSVENVINASEESSVDDDENPFFPQIAITVKNPDPCYDDSHIYANVAGISVSKPSDEEDSENETLSKSENPSTHYREMTHAEIQKLNVSDEEEILGRFLIFG